MKIEEAIKKLAEIKCDNIEQRNIVVELLHKNGITRNTPDAEMGLVIMTTTYNMYFFAEKHCLASCGYPRIPAADFISANKQ